MTFDHPPINTITATTVAELAELVGLIEQDPDLNVVVVDGANPDFYLAHYDVENDPSRTAALGVGPTGIWPLTYMGKYQGRVAAANILGRERIADYDAVPRVVFTDPQAASVGEPEGAMSATVPLRS